MRVLVADDDPTTVVLVRDALTRFGYEVNTARDGKEAWQALCGAEIPIVVTDLQMPIEDGIQLCKRVRSAKFEHYTYIVLLTHYPDRKNLLDALASGADDFLAKPLDQERLRARLMVAQRIVTLERELRETNNRLIRRNLGLEALSRVDPLTGAGNRTAFQDQIEFTHAKALRSGRPYGIVVCDLDRFKQINDKMGHRSGDQALARCVTAIRQVVRKGDVIFRYGGDEIVLIIADEGLEYVRRLADRACEELRHTTFHGEGGNRFHVTASFGVATYPETSGEGADWAEVFGLADEAMYLAKRGGGDGVRTADKLDDDGEGLLRNRTGAEASTLTTA